MASPAKLKTGLLTHFLVFGAGLLFFTVQSGSPPPWMIWWGLGFVLHAAATFRKLKRPEGQADTPRQSKAQPEARPQSPSALIDRVLDALAELESAWEEQDALQSCAPDFAKLSETAQNLHERHEALSELCARAQGLPEQVEALQARLASSPTESEASVLERELDALLDRLASHQAAESVMRQLESELRTLLHRAEALRLDVVQSGVDVPELDTRAQEIRAQLEAASEVDEHLARARRAARAQTRR